jgi:hypothetical protein
MTARQVTLAVTGWGVVTAIVLALGFDTVGGLAALVHLGGLIGAPHAMLLARQARSLPVVAVLSIALSLAMSALAAQALIWFDAASGPLLVVTATAYSAVLAALLASPDGGWLRSR